MSPHARPLIAVTGIGVRLPGGITSPDQLWDALLDGQPLTGPIPDARWARMTTQLHPDHVPEKP